MAKVQYGTPAAQSPKISQDDMVRFLALQAQLGGNPQDPQYDPLGETLDFNKPHPVYSAGQGIADVLGQVGSAYLKRQQYEKAAKQQSANATLVMDPMATATNTGLSHDSSNLGLVLDKGAFQGRPFDPSRPPTQLTQGPSPNSSLVEPTASTNVGWDTQKINAMPGLTADERGNMAYQQLGAKNAVLANAVRPQLMQAAQAAQPPLPKYTPITEAGLLQENADGTTKVIPGTPKPGAPHILGANMLDDSGKVLYTDKDVAAHLRAETAASNASAAASTQKTNLMKDIPEGVTGPAVLDILSPTERASVQGIVDGNQPLPSRTANPAGQRIAGLVELVDPTYTPQRLKVKQDVAVGPTSQNIKRLGTAIGHIDSLITSMGSLGNMGGVGTLLNAPKNYIAGKTGSAGINNVNLNADAVASELEAAFRGSGSSITGIHEWRKNISPNMSPEQQAGIKEKALDLLDSRLDSIANQWNQVMPPTQHRDPMDFLSPEQQQVYAKLKGVEQAPENAAKPPGEMSNEELLAHLNGGQK